MNLTDRLARMESRARKQKERGDQRHHEIDERFQAIERNTARIAALETALAAHMADNKRHTGKA